MSNLPLPETVTTDTTMDQGLAVQQDKCPSPDINLNYNLEDECSDFYTANVLVADSKAAKQLSDATVGQSKNKAWKAARMVRITASKFKAVVNRRKKDHTKLIESLIRPSSFSNKWTQWGTDGEAVALAAYVKQKSDEGYHVISKADLGLVVNPNFPYLGASLDCFIRLEKYGQLFQGAVEIKTLAKHAPLTLSQAAEVPGIFFQCNDNKLSLNKDHTFYYQVQGQMFISGLEWCDIFVWTPQGSDYETVRKDNTLWATMLTKLSDFYFFHLLPALVSEGNKRDSDEVINK
jgi:hypothetical protein